MSENNSLSYVAILFRLPPQCGISDRGSRIADRIFAGSSPGRTLVEGEKGECEVRADDESAFAVIRTTFLHFVEDK
ncbi:unnamed protein product [Protopolystoma xenopodis]|uniref:Uncharacterized protein n=1 Tax=Protopolystoma xenopodis TaxID=117903 RepID=A0A3S5A2K8_9PLAT|nr:unnamed protein product [Protopolystoma xenopodis]